MSSKTGEEQLTIDRAQDTGSVVCSGDCDVTSPSLMPLRGPLVYVSEMEK